MLTIKVEVEIDKAALDPEKCWQAFVSKDAIFDGQFYVAVRSTHIFCRPSCPSRLPKRENVVFFGQAQKANKRGFGPANAVALWKSKTRPAGGVCP